MLDLVGDDLDKVLHRVVYGVISPELLTKQQNDRLAEFSTKFRKALLESIGDERLEMYELGGLATRPSKQGLGYGSAMVNFVTGLADANRRGTWLGSSNVANTGFYESFGFRTVAEFVVGESDPTWTDPPVLVKVMSRKYGGPASVNTRR
ncbi:hypothetical protein BDW22DRAFT_461668 [Trametopsis cervina]|nr:hypothetical protein BDW22DRAFT_461668 [Trametopsis cervina]